MSGDVRRGFRDSFEEFIELYRSEPCLWQIKCKDYHNRDKKNSAYDKLVDKLKEIDPEANREKVVKKINSIRTNYRKEQKKIEHSQLSDSGAGEVYKPSLWYFKLLSFIDDQGNPRTARSGIFMKDETSEPETEISPNEIEETTIKDEYPVEFIPFTPSYPPPSSERTRPSKRSACTNLTREVLLGVHDHFKRAIPEDRCDVYGKTVAMTLRELPKTQRLFAEKIINDTLFEAQMGNLTITHRLTNDDERCYQYNKQL